MHGTRWGLRLVALMCASVAVTGTVLPLSRAGADQIADKRAEAARIAAALYADSLRVDSLTARFEAAQLDVEKADARVAATTDDLRSAQARIDETRKAVRELAVTQYMQGRATPKSIVAMPGDSDAHGVAMARFFSDVAVSNTQDVLDASRAAQEDYQARLGDLQAEQRRAHAIAAGLQAARRSAAAAVAQQRAHLDQVKGDLAGLVAAEQARQQAAREARARATVRTDVVPANPSGRSGRGGVAPPVDSSRASIAVEEARRQLGKPYHWGGAGPNSFDCSGLTMWAWRAAGVSLPHHSGSQYDMTVHIPLDQLQPGDLVFFHRRISHVGIYVGNGQMIHAPETGDVVRYASIYAEGSPIYAGRVRT